MIEWMSDNYGVALWFGIPITTIATGTGIYYSYKQLKIAKGKSLQDKYQSGIEMLGNESMITRFGGINQLSNIAKDRPEEYHIEIVRTLTDFIKLRAREENVESCEDIERAIEGISFLNKKQSSIENKILEENENAFPSVRLENVNLDRLEMQGATRSKLYFYNSYLRYGNFSGATLSKFRSEGNSKFDAIIFENAKLPNASIRNTQLQYADLSKAILTKSRIFKSDLSGAKLTGADLSNAFLCNSDLSGADLTGANLTNTNISGVILTDAKISSDQLNQAIWTKHNPPIHPEVEE